MSLVKYRKKRSAYTPEPTDTEKKTTSESAPIFVVQKHSATSLHYDFRLEYKGVLLSWAVPKGFPTDSGERHLAKQVEDHPFSYRNFEGVIPEGSYGAGAVIVWDRGHYISGNHFEKAEIEKEIEEGLKKGHLSFILAGEKINGHFALVKIGGQESDWLLVEAKNKIREQYINFSDKSVISGLTVEDTYNGIPGPMPHNIKPMMAEIAASPFDREGWIFEVKWDGYRAIAEIENKRVNLYSRNLKSYNEKFKELASELSKVENTMILDGEIVVVDQEGKPDFQALQDYSKTKSGNLVYYIFDLLYLNGRNLMDLPLFRRRELLKQFFPQGKNLKFSDHIETNGKAFFNAAIERGIEGVVAKGSGSKYKPGLRSRNWLKIKREKTVEAIIVGYTLPESGRKYFSALILAAHDKKGELKFIGHVGTGFDDRKLRDLSNKFNNLILEQSALRKIPKLNSQAVWLRPVLVCSVKFSEWTKEKILRQPVFLNLRDDIDPREVIIAEKD